MEVIVEGESIDLRTFSLIAALIASLFCAAGLSAQEPPRIVLVGDSTVSDYPATRPDRGWGQFVEERFKAGAVKVINLAAPGRSTKTFIEEGRWQRALAEKPHYVIIQFGHNDSHAPQNPESTAPATDYKNYLRRYIDESRAMGATPILVTPVVRRTFDARGRIIEAQPPPNRPLVIYADAMKEVGRERNVATIDLYAASKALCESLGPAASAGMANSHGDATHFNETGARAIAELVVRELPRAERKLEAYLKAAPALTVTSRGSAGDFPLASARGASPIYVDARDFPVVHIAVDALAADIESVIKAKARPRVVQDVPAPVENVVLVGTLGRSRLIESLVAAKKLDVSALTGAWESFVVATVPNPLPGVKQGLVIVGSDRRGTAYGVFALSEAIGVSPWHWWADVPPRRRAALFVSSRLYRQLPPAVKYRGIFINDEDWGIQEWAEKNYESHPGEVGDIGPKTYAQVFELLLRMKANYLWPAMHDSTKPFNSYAQNKVVADRYAIVMGSSHAEPMLRNNVGEWPHDQANMWNPVTNLPRILEYWEQRVRENGRYENVYTVGMRGIHDGSMPGGGTLDEKRDRLEKIIGLQREILTRQLNADASRVPQIFVPYKEVLEIYQSGMTLPDDITVVWPDDNLGYIRQLPNAGERERAGGHGVYYHLSYWGRPHDYLWLESTAPALIWEEMTKAYEFGARALWVVNIGDIKPIEAGTTLFLKLAWDVHRHGPNVQQTFLRDFYAQQFGAEHADAIADLKDEYFRLCAIRRPEHMGFNRVYFKGVTSNTPVQDSDWSHAPENDEASRLLARWLELARRAEGQAHKLPRELRDAYFQLVEYPARAGAAMAEKIILAEKARLSGSNTLARRAQAALLRIEQLTERYNAQKAGKWRGMMDHRPRRLPVFDMPPTHHATGPVAKTALIPAPQRSGRLFDIDATKFSRAHDRQGAGWRVIEGLGPRGGVIAVLPRSDLPTLRSPHDIRERAPVAEYTVKNAHAGDVEVIVEALPTHAFTPAHPLVVALSIDDGQPTVVPFEQGKDDEDDPTWQTNVLRSAMFGKVTLRVPDRPYTLELWGVDSGVVVQRITIVQGTN
jgi:lysophospholipase L1-like esterase